MYATKFHSEMTGINLYFASNDIDSLCGLYSAFGNSLLYEDSNILDTFCADNGITIFNDEYDDIPDLDICIAYSFRF